MTSTQVTQAQASTGLFIRATSKWPNNTATLATIGQGATATNLTNIATGYDRTFTLASNVASGTVVLKTNNANGTWTTSGINEKDFEGEDLGTITSLKALLIRCNSGNVSIAGDTANLVDCTLTSGGKVEYVNNNGLGTAFTNLTITIQANASNSIVQLTVAGA